MKVSRLCEGLGDVTCNVAEYRALILGMKYALKKGFKLIRVQGDSNLVCMQVHGLIHVTRLPIIFITVFHISHFRENIQRRHINTNKLGFQNFKCVWQRTCCSHILYTGWHNWQINLLFSTFS